MKVAFLICAGGSAFHAAVSKLDKGRRSLMHVVTDRFCEAERRADDLGVARTRVSGTSRAERSRAIAEVVRETEARSCIVLFDRLVTADLFDAVPCVNIHPSLLPMYPGVDAVERAFRAGEKYLGVTAHLIDEGIDTGPILVQRRSHMPASLAEAAHVSFRQKANLVESIILLLQSHPKPTRDWLLSPEVLRHWN